MTIVVPVFNGEDVLGLTAPAVLAQDVERIVYVDDGSTDGTSLFVRDLAASDPRVTVCTHPTNRGRGHARNTGMEATTGDLVLFLDADVAPEAGYAEALHDKLQNPDVVAVVGSFRLGAPVEDDPYHTYLASSRRGVGVARSGSIPWKHFLSGVCGVRRSALETAGGFPVDIAYGEDLALACRLSRHAPHGLWSATDAHAKLFGVGDLDTALRLLREFAEALPRIQQSCPNVLQVAGLERLGSSAAYDRLLVQLARSGWPARVVRRNLERLPRAMWPLAVRYLLGHSLAVHAGDALTS